MNVAEECYTFEAVPVSIYQLKKLKHVMQLCESHNEHFFGILIRNQLKVKNVKL